MSTDTMNNVISLAKRRGFLFPGSAIYGGLANAWDYGPLGAELKNNIRQEWWRWFVHRRADIVGIDPAIFMNSRVWEASGHLEEFADPLVECEQCGKRHRQEDVKDACPECGERALAKPRAFNLLFKTTLGPLADSSADVYLRGELAQAMFVNFAQVQQTMRQRVPFGIAAWGKVFRNEITPGNFIYRTREFDLMEFEYFVHEKSWKEHFAFWQEEMKKWLHHMGVDAARVHERDVPKKELAHYSQKTVDFEYDYPFGRRELYGLAYRGDFDLKNHMEKSGERLSYTDPETDETFIPHVVEPTFGLDRSVLVALLEAYEEEEVPTAQEGKTETRVVMRFPHWMAPVKAAILPLVKNEERITAQAREIFESVSQFYAAQYDEGGSIGRRYRRQDEAGTPLCITVDFDTEKSGTVTVRDRDTMKQERIPVDDIIRYIHECSLTPK